MNPNIPLSEHLAVAAVIDPASLATGAHNSGWVSIVNLPQVLAVVHAGTLGSSGKIDAKLQQATDSSGTGAKDITGKAITQITANNKVALINCYDYEVDVNNGFTHVQLVVTVTTAASQGSAVVLGANAKFGPASDFNATEVAETVT